MGDVIGVAFGSQMIGMEEKLMEQLNVMTQQDNEKIIRILSDLLTKDKEFQIMITVPAGSKLTDSRKKQTADPN